MLIVGITLLLGTLGWLSFISHYDGKSGTIKDPRTIALTAWPIAPIGWILAFVVFKAFSCLQGVFKKSGR